MSFTGNHSTESAQLQASVHRELDSVEMAICDTVAEVRLVRSLHNDNWVQEHLGESSR